MSDDREAIFQGHIIDVVRLERKWEVVRHPPAVAVLVRDGGRVLGVRQRRHAVDADTWELPAGLIEEGEAPVEAARRELAEETNLTGRFVPLARSYSSPGFTDELVYLYEALDVRFADGTPDADEELELEWREVRELWSDMLNGDLLTSTVTLLGLHHALHALQGREPVL